MRKVLIFIIPIVLAFVVFFVIQFFVNRNSGRGALQVTSVPKSMVFLNGRLLGQTPLCKCEGADMIKIGEYTLRIVPQGTSFPPFEAKIKISKSILTVIDRTFGQGATSDASIISLSSIDDSKSLELLVISFPDNAEILVDNNKSGKTPILLKDLTESDHEVKIKKDGYSEKNVRIRTVKGYKLTVESFLGIDPNFLTPTQVPSPTPTITVNPSLTPTPKGKISPSISPSISSSSKVLILDTPNGFLRVRDDASLAGAEIARVTPGETFPLLDESNGWYKIKLKDGTMGWVSAQFAEKQ